MAGSQRMTMTWCHHSYPTPIRTLGGTLLGFCPWPPYLIFVCGHWARVHGHWPNHHGEVSKQGGRVPIPQHLSKVTPGLTFLRALGQAAAALLPNSGY